MRISRKETGIGFRLLYGFFQIFIRNQTKKLVRFGYKHDILEFAIDELNNYLCERRPGKFIFIFNTAKYLCKRKQWISFFCGYNLQIYCLLH